MKNNNVIELNVKKQELDEIKSNSHTMSIIFTYAGDDANTEVVVGGALSSNQMIVGVAALIDTITDMLDLESMSGNKYKVYEKLMGEISDFSRILVLGDRNDEMR